MPAAKLAYITDAPSRTFIPNFRPAQIERSRRDYSPPVRFVPALPSFDLQEVLGALAPAEVRALHFIAENGDLITVDGRDWLLVPATPAILDTLAAVGASGEDREPILEDESETDCEASRDYLDDSDGLPGDPEDADPDDLF